MTSRMTYLPEKKLVELEKLSEAEMASFIMTVGTQKAAETFVAALRSYRITASVANAGWKVAQEAASGSISAESFQQLQKTLANYSPANFPPFKSDLEFHCRSLEELYDHLSQWNFEGSNTMVMMEQLFERISQARKLLNG